MKTKYMQSNTSNYFLSKTAYAYIFLERYACKHLQAPASTCKHLQTVSSFSTAFAINGVGRDSTPKTWTATES